MKQFSFTLSPFNNIVLGLLLLMIGNFARRVFDNDVLLIVLGAMAWWYILYGWISIRKSVHANHFGRFFSFLFVVYLLICIVMIIRGYLIDYRYQWQGVLSAINYHVFNQTYILPYLMPMIVLIPYKNYKFDTIIKWSVILSYLTILLFVVYYSEIVLTSSYKAQGIDVDGMMDGSEIVLYGKLAFVALCSNYISSNKWRLNIISLCIVVIVLLIAARRGSSLTYILLLIFSMFLYFKRTNFLSKILVIFLFIFAYYFVMESSWFDYLFQRGMEDTRSAVEEAQMAQMTDFEKWFGKGLNGRYYLPLRQDEYLEGWRYGCETGFYNLVLKGGYLMAYAYILLLLIPSFKGLFKSNNQLCKAGGFYILLSLFELYPFGWLTFDVKFLIIWMMIVLCMNPKVRRLNDRQIKKLFF